MFKQRERKDKMNGKFVSTKWVLDSGASYHMTSDLHILFNLHSLDEPVHISFPDGIMIIAKKAGQVKVRENLVLKEVLYTPTFTCNLISIQRLAEADNCVVTYGADFCVIQDLASNKPIRMGDMRNKVYYFKDGTSGTGLAAISSKETVLWHKRLGHPSVGSLSTISASCELQINQDAVTTQYPGHNIRQDPMVGPLKLKKGSWIVSMVLATIVITCRSALIPVMVPSQQVVQN